LCCSYILCLPFSLLLRISEQTLKEERKETQRKREERSERERERATKKKNTRIEEYETLLYVSICS
jgi:hypothetical protein